MFIMDEGRGGTFWTSIYFRQFSLYLTRLGMRRGVAQKISDEFIVVFRNIRNEEWVAWAALMKVIINPRQANYIYNAIEQICNTAKILI